MYVRIGDSCYTVSGDANRQLDMQVESSRIEAPILNLALKSWLECAPTCLLPPTRSVPEVEQSGAQTSRFIRITQRDFLNLYSSTLAPDGLIIHACNG